MAWDYRTGTPRWRPDQADDMPGGPTTRKPFSDESKDRGWTPYDEQSGLGRDPSIIAAPAGYTCLWVADDHWFCSPIVAWIVHEGGRTEWATLTVAPDGFTATAIEAPDGQVYSGLDVFGSRNAWLEWRREEEGDA